MSCLSSRIEIFLHVLSSVCSLSLRFLLLLRVCWAIFPIFYEPWVCLDCVTNSSPTLLCGRGRNSFFNLQNLVSVELLCAQNGDLNLSNKISRKISVKIFFFSFYHFQSGEKLMNEERRFVTWNSRAGWGLVDRINWLCNFFSPASFPSIVIRWKFSSKTKADTL